MPVFSIDPLQHHSLLIDTRKRWLVDGNNNLSVCVTFLFGCRLSAVNDPFYKRTLDKHLQLRQTRPKIAVCIQQRYTSHKNH